MGALAPISTTWIPEDDLALKNAVEAGASLESLAKGAVQFSRKFTVRELQDRWYSLLYDPVISAEAAFHMIEFEHSVYHLPSRSNKTGNSKESKVVSGKRKLESVRSCYNALRKKIRNEPFNAMDMNFLITPSSSNHIGSGDEPFTGNCLSGDTICDHFELKESELDDLQCALPAEEEFTMQAHNLDNGISHILGKNGAGELGCPKDLPSEFDQRNGCSEFEGHEIYELAVPECGEPFPNLDYPSPPTGMTEWRTAEGISSTAILVSLREVNSHTEDTFVLPDHGSAVSISTSDKMQNPSVNTENYLAELSHSLLNFTNEEELFFMDADGKDLIDKSYYDGLNSLLLSEQNEVSQDQVPNVTEREKAVAPEDHTNPIVPCSEEFDNTWNSEQRDGRKVCNSEVQIVSSTSAPNPEFPELVDGVICCTLNTEDPEIPCNDDILLPGRMHFSPVSSLSQWSVREAATSNSICFKELAGNLKASEGGTVLIQRERINAGQSHASSQKVGSQVVPETGQLYPDGDCGVKLELANSQSCHVGSKTERIASSIDSKVTGSNALVPAKVKEETTEIAPAKRLGHKLTDSKEKLDSRRSYPQMNASGSKQELDMQLESHDHRQLNAKVGFTDIAAPEPIANPPLAELEEQSFESDDGVPYFSDVEAMILDMDLDPNDQDLYEQEVSRYMHEDAVKAIIRLEQGAHSYMQRAISSHGAFAVLYGRHSKHYIKRPEVLLGRSAENIIADIDLGREGCANKISRRQAIISMDKGGCFQLENLGKFPILINNKEVAPKQSLSIASGCLIEIKGMRFIFETNRTCVRRYLDSIAKSQTQECQP